jgi:hypothetical protein
VPPRAAGGRKACSNRLSAAPGGCSVIIPCRRAAGPPEPRARPTRAPCRAVGFLATPSDPGRPQPCGGARSAAAAPHDSQYRPPLRGFCYHPLRGPWAHLIAPPPGAHFAPWPSQRLFRRLPAPRRPFGARRRPRRRPRPRRSRRAPRRFRRTPLPGFPVPPPWPRAPCLPPVCGKHFRNLTPQPHPPTRPWNTCLGTGSRGGRNSQEVQGRRTHPKLTRPPQAQGTLWIPPPVGCPGRRHHVRGSAAGTQIPQGPRQGPATAHSGHRPPPPPPGAVPQPTRRPRRGATAGAPPPHTNEDASWRGSATWRAYRRPAVDGRRGRRASRPRRAPRGRRAGAPSPRGPWQCASCVLRCSPGAAGLGVRVEGRGWRNKDCNASALAGDPLRPATPMAAARNSKRSGTRGVSGSWGAAGGRGTGEQRSFRHAASALGERWR